MDEPVVTPLPSRGGRPRKYNTEAEKRAAFAEARRKKRAAQLEAQDLPPLPPIAPASGPVDLQTAIAMACAKLNVADAMFVSAVCSGKTQTEAYKLAHPAVSESSASTNSSKTAALPHIAKALAEVRQALAANVAYDFNAFMAEMDRAIAFAHATRNATAMVRAVELKGKATGSLSDKPLGQPGNGFTLNIIGVESPPTAERIDG